MITGPSPRSSFVNALLMALGPHGRERAHGLERALHMPGAAKPGGRNHANDAAEIDDERDPISEQTAEQVPDAVEGVHGAIAIAQELERQTVGGSEALV